MTGESSPDRPGWRIAVFGALFFAITSITIATTRFGGGLALVWPGTAIAAAMLVGLPRQRWSEGIAVIVVTSTLATTLFGFGPTIAAPLALVNAFEAWLVARLLLVARPEGDWFENVSGLGPFIAIAGVVAPAIAAVPGGIVASLVATGGPLHHALNWIAGHGLGTLLVFPLAYLVSTPNPMAVRRQISRRSVVELTGHLAFVTMVAVLTIDQSDLPLLFVPIVPVLLAAFRCGREGAALSSIIVALVTIMAFYRQDTTVHAFGVTAPTQVLFFQFYIVTISLLALPVSVALRQYRLVLGELEQRKTLKRLIADHSDDALLNLDGAGRIRYASPAGERLSGVADLDGQSLHVFFDPLDEDMLRTALERAAAAPGETITFERPVFRLDAELWLEAKLRAVAVEGRDEGLQGFAVTIRDVTERKQAELDAIEAAETDALTGLANRRALLRQLDRALIHPERRPFAFAIVDLDHFKSINDTHGHVAGDAVLKAVGEVMQRLGGPGRFFARLGGEEFALITSQPDFDHAQMLSEVLRREIEALRFTGDNGTRFTVTASIGLARVGAGQSATQALQAADLLLYRAKRGGRNMVVTTVDAEQAPRRAA